MFKAHSISESYTRNFGGYLELLCLWMSFAKLSETFELKSWKLSSMVSRFSTSSEPSEMISKLTKLLAWDCIDLLIEAVVTNVTLGLFEARRLVLCDHVGDKESLGYEFPSPIFSNALSVSVLKKFEEEIVLTICV